MSTRNLDKMMVPKSVVAIGASVRPGSVGAAVTRNLLAGGLIGLRTRVLNATRGEAIMHHRFDSFRPVEGDIPKRANGVIVSQDNGRAVTFALWNLQERTDLFVNPGDEVYEGMIVGENSRSTDLDVNIVREKKMSNMRSSGADEAIRLVPPRLLTLEMVIEFVRDEWSEPWRLASPRCC